METDDAVTPNLALTVSMNIQVELGFESPSLRFVEPLVGNAQRQTVKVVGSALATTSFGAVSSDVEGLTAQMVKRTVDGVDVHELEAQLVAPKTGAVHGTIRVDTTLPTVPALTLQVYAQVKGNVSVEPRVVSIDPEADPAGVYPVIVRSARPGLKITGVTDGNGYVDGKAVADKDGTWRVELSLTPRARPTGDVFSTTVRIATAYPEEPFVEVAASRGINRQRPISRETVRRAVLPGASAAGPAPAAPPPTQP